MQQVNSTLYALNKDGSFQCWKVFIVGNQVVVEFGKVGGKKQQKVTTCEPKNVGRSNETTAEQQALAEAVSKWEKQVRLGYRDDTSKLEQEENFSPMLAHDATKRSKSIVYPAYVQPKLDGVRALVTLDADGFPQFNSRGNKLYPVPLDSELSEQVKSLSEHSGFDKFDGELYIHGLSLQKIVALAKKWRTPEQIEEEIPQANVAVLSGPSHAEEVSRELPTTVVVGAETEETAIYLQKIFMNDVFRVYTSPDIKGIELGGSLKNVIALAAGVADGLGYGDNTKAALITRGIAEITRLGVKMGGKLESFTGLTGIGDLIVTCASKHSRNRKAGVLIGEGMTMEEAMAEVKMVVEGVYSAKAARELAEKYEVSMPIVEKVNQVLFEGKPAKDAVSELMMRDGRSEYSNLPWD